MSKSRAISHLPDYDMAKSISKLYRSKLEAQAKDLGISPKQVVAMSMSNDPYWMTTGRVLQGMWAKSVVDRFVRDWMATEGVGQMHLRGIHYALTKGNELTWKGLPYQNTQECWDDLISCFGNARYLNMVDWNIIYDKKNEFYQETDYDEPDSFDDAVDNVMSNVTVDGVVQKLITDEFKELLNPTLYQPIHIEIWSEKSFVLLDQVIEKWGVNSVIGEGETSITQVYLAVERFKEANKPVRIGYISDCDVAGSNMVKSMARKLEYILDDEGLDLDVRVVPLMVTPEQVKELGLPTTPHKPSSGKAYNTRIRKWLRSRLLSGAVEANTMEALYPKRFRQEIEDFIRKYTDISKWNKVVEMKKSMPDKIMEVLDLDQLDLTPLRDLIDDVDWDKLRDGFEKDEKAIGISNMDYSKADSFYGWVLESNDEYWEQLFRYGHYDNGDLPTRNIMRDK